MPGRWREMWREMWREHRFLSVLFAGLVAIAVLFTARSVMFAVYWADPAHEDQALAGWMTPRYVAHSWSLPPERLKPIVNPDGTFAPRRTLSEIARAEGIPLEELIARIEAEIDRHRAETE